jgi:hypothetical protein
MVDPRQSQGQPAHEKAPLQAEMMAPQPGEGRHQPGKAPMPTQGSGELGGMGQGADATPGRRAHKGEHRQNQRAR